MPIIADVDAGFGNAEATYLPTSKMIEAGACALQIENQVSDQKQCGHRNDFALRRTAMLTHRRAIEDDPRSIRYGNLHQRLGRLG